MRKILRRPKLPDLFKYKDVADYVMGGGGASDSEADDMEDAKVEIAAGNRAIEGRHGARPSKEAEEAAVKLTEVGPRMRLSLLKIEDGFCSGEVLYHRHVSKDPQEVAVRRAEMERRKAEKEARKMQQQQNVKRKQQRRAASTGSDADESDEGVGHPLDSVKTENEGLWSDEDDDAAYYKEQVGEEAEAGAFRHAKKVRKNEGAGGGKDGKERGPKGGEKPKRTIQEQIAHRKALKAKREKQKAKKRIRSKKK